MSHDMNAQTARLGWVEIYEGPADKALRFWVYDWTEAKDSGALVGDFATRADAVAFAVNWAVTHGRKLQSAEVSHFPLRLKGGVA